MKLSKLILTGVFATTMMGASFAANTVEDTTSMAAVTIVNEEEAPKEIKVSELPKAIHAVLKENEYEAEKAYLMQRNGEVIYQVEAKKEGENMTFMFDENGKEIKK